ncbi:MAG: BON domain-containing protein [Chromatiales bacterium]|nr:BON domain-containing protein [Gammaproteobacteria bacterium]MBW6477441.1 BON domain-containing protein [Chromatiales bacterium]
MVRVLAVTVLVMFLSACATAVSTGYGQGGQMADGRSYSEAYGDNQISAAVNTALVQDSLIKASDIRVSTRDGVVTLDGRVASIEQARRAASLAASVSGVKRVINRLAIVQ